MDFLPFSAEQNAQRTTHHADEYAPTNTRKGVNAQEGAGGADDARVKYGDAEPEEGVEVEVKP